MKTVAIGGCGLPAASVAPAGRICVCNLGMLHAYDLVGVKR